MMTLSIFPFFDLVPFGIGLLALAAYAIFCYQLYRIAKKAGFEDAAVLAFIPIINFGLMFKITGRSPWMMLLLLIPVVNIVILGMVYYDLVKLGNKPGWWLILMFINPINIWVLYVIANEMPGNGEGSSKKSQPSGGYQDPFLRSVPID